MINMQIHSQIIKQIRDQKCWSQQQLADMSGISLRTLQRVEAKSVASQETIKALAAVLEIGCEQLVVAEKQPDADPGLSSRPSSEKRNLLITTLVIVCVFAFSIWSVFGAYERQQLNPDEFQFLKGLVSAAFLLGLAGVLYHGYKTGLVKKSDFL